MAAAAAVSVGPVFAFASALVSVGPSLQGLYAANTVVTAVVISTINLLLAQNEAALGFFDNKNQDTWFPTNNIASEYYNIFTTAGDFIELANSGFPQYPTDTLRNKILSPTVGMQNAIDRLVYYGIMNIPNDISAFLQHCQILPNVSNCQTSAAVYGINLLEREIMAYNLLLWAKGPTTNMQTRQLLDNMFSNITRQILSIELRLGSYYVYGPSNWIVPVSTEPVFASLGGNLFNVDFFVLPDGTPYLYTEGAPINRQAYPTTFWGSSQVLQTYQLTTKRSIYVRPSLVSFGNLLHLVYLGENNNVYYLTYSTSSGTWTPCLTLAATTLFPDFNAADGGFSSSIFQLISSGGNMYFIGVSPTQGVKVYKLSGSTAPVLVGIGLGDASWGLPQYYRTFQALDLDGTLYVFGRGSAGMVVCKLNPSGTTLMQIITVSEFSNSQGWGNNYSYSTIKVLYVNKDLIFFGRTPSGVVLYVYQQFLANPYSTALSYSLAAWSDASGFGTAYETIKAYTANNVAFFSVFVNKKWQTCVLKYPFAVFDCQANTYSRINTPPDVVNSLGPYYGVVNYDWLKGSVPMFYYTVPMPNSTAYQIMMLSGNPFQITFNFNNTWVDIPGSGL